MKCHFLIFTFLCLIVACSSEVDKCVSAIHKNNPDLNQQEKNELEVNARLICLKAQAGRD